jgi:uroporphyrinogen decarboxylase
MDEHHRIEVIQKKKQKSLFKNLFIGSASGDLCMTTTLMRLFAGEKLTTPPIWLMRQAGRYLPEYREVRRQAGSFLDLCYNTELATEVTLQPIRRFGFDASILFSDILVVPHAMGQKVWFEEGEGPRLEQISSSAELTSRPLKFDLDRLAPVIRTVEALRVKLPAETTLIGFCGAPWTVASYMIAGKGTPDQAPARLVAYSDPDFLQAVIDQLVDASIIYLRAQLAAGAEVVQIFESFASALPPSGLERWSMAPIAKIVQGVKAAYPKAMVMVFARGAAPLLARYAETTSADGFGIDWGADLDKAVGAVPPGCITQGNLDPLALVAGGKSLDDGVAEMMKVARRGNHIVNLGHGILQQTPIEHVERLMQLVRQPVG